MKPSEDRRGYLLCASPRSGSTLLCDLLTRTGVAGAPESYARPASITHFAEAWGVAGDASAWDRRYVDAVREHGTAGTGRFGMRIMGSDLTPFTRRLRAIEPTAHDDTEALHVLLGIEQYVYLTRVDRVAQAVSLVLATQTGLWHRNADGTERQREAPGVAPHYDHDRIADELRLLDDEASEWQTWFDSNGVTPLAVTYEELSADPSLALADVLGFLGTRAGELPTPGTARLATETNDEWCRRFRAERSG